MRSPKQYVIEVSGAPGACWFAGFDDEAEAGDPVSTTSEEANAARYVSFADARQDVRALSRSHPDRQFRINVLG